MGQSLSKQYIHLIFSTKHRHPFIQPNWKDRLHGYIYGALKVFDSPSLIINSMPDHVHILFVLSKNYSLAKIVEEIKKQSSRWIKQSFPDSNNFAWQPGYAGFSVSSSKVEVVKRYIENQNDHHKKRSFTEELIDFLEEYDVDYNREYL